MTISLRFGPPYVGVQIGRKSEVSNDLALAVAGAADIDVRFLRGDKMGTAERLFDETAAALQFPEYFGENWNALDDCLSDLSWWPASRRALVVWNAHRVLEKQPEAFGLWVELLQKIADEWASSDEFRAASPLCIVLHAEKSDEDELERLLAGSGAKYIRCALSK